MKDKRDKARGTNHHVGQKLESDLERKRRARQNVEQKIVGNNQVILNLKMVLLEGQVCVGDVFVICRDRTAKEVCMKNSGCRCYVWEILKRL